MRLKFSDVEEYQVVNPRAFEIRNSDLAALQRETGWKTAKIQELMNLEAVSMAIMIFATMRKHGRMISYAKAETLLDAVEVIHEPGDEPGPEPEQEPEPDPQ